MSKRDWLITGSVAAHHWFPGVWEKCSDIDILTPHKVTSGMPLRIETQWHKVAEEIIDRNVDNVFVDPDMLFTIKYSHAEWPIKWDKTMFDIWKFQQQGCNVIEDIVPRLKEVWKEIHGKKKVNLKQDVSEFFSHDVVRRKYPHELVHEMVAFYERPMHERIRPNGSSVWCDRGMFEALPYTDRIRCAQEELMVTAIERSNLTSNDSALQSTLAIGKAFKQLVTSMTTGWFNNFLILNAFEIQGKEARYLMVQQINNSLKKLENL